MAPDSSYWGHQLGGTTNRFRHCLLKTTLPVCLLTLVSATNLEARTEPPHDSWSGLSASFLAHERPAPDQRNLGPSLFLPFQFFNTPPVGPWSTQNQIRIPDHPAIDKYVTFFSNRGRLTFETSLERSWTYMPIMAEILESHGVPAELACVVMIESSFKNRRASRGPGGWWQLLASTARSLGLRVDRWVDERMDPVKSTQAAAKYLRAAYEQYGSWPMALAAYNVGDGPVQHAARCCGNDFWSILRSRRLPSRTLAYVPKVLAAMKLMRDLDSHGFQSPKYHQVYDFETIWVAAPLELKQVARWIDVPEKVLQELNPALRQNQLPPGSGFSLRLPSGARDKFDIAYASYVK